VSYKISGKRHVGGGECGNAEMLLKTVLHHEVSYVYNTEWEWSLLRIEGRKSDCGTGAFTVKGLTQCYSIPERIFYGNILIEGKWSGSEVKYVTEQRV
jgi:hypothetical protein